MTDISFMSANLVARELDWNMPSWEAGDRAVQEAFAPVQRFAEKFDEVLATAEELGFRAIDLWNAHLDPDWATDRHVDLARRLLGERGLRVASLAGWFGADRGRFTATCRIAVAVGAPVLGGGVGNSLLHDDRQWLAAELGRNGLRLGLENHPEKTPREMLERIGDGGGGAIGATVDTGWWGTQGYDAALAIEELGRHVFHVHLKDALEGPRHLTCGYGEGVVPLRQCVKALQRIGYSGAISVEHHAGDHDPRPAVGAGRALLEGWLAEEAA